ncbi:MAG: hypothetical protein IT556_16885 [Acetobacteraceae bacterium]|nr:hypothetical protein [Acetobacteraceae bacterium]
MALPEAARINGDRLWSTIDRSAGIGKGRPGGLSRLALTDSDKEMRDQFVAWCNEAGLAVSIGRLGSIFGRRATSCCRSGREALAVVSTTGCIDSDGLHPVRNGGPQH